MPIGKIKIKSTRKSNYGEMVEVNNYWFDETCEPLAVIYGCFSPFTGKFGHARLLEAAKAKGIDKFIIVSPNKKEQLDNDRNMFTLSQKVNIAKEGCLDLGYDVVDARIGKWSFVLGNLNDIAAEYDSNRIMLVCGPDRAEEYGKDLIAFDETRIDELPNERERGRYELLVVSDRGEKNVSGTKVRETIRDDDKETFLNLTGYSESMWQLCRKYAIMNGVVSENFYEHLLGFTLLNEALDATKRVGIKHLYNPGNSQELQPLDFLKLVDLLDAEGGVLTNGENVAITEKSDGAAFRFGLDEEGKFFIEQSYSGPVYTAQNFIDTSRKRTGGVNRIARGWANIFNVLKADEKTQKCLRHIFDEIGAFKLCGEIFISDLGYEDKDGFVTFVGSRYDKAKLGSVATIILFNGINADETDIEYLIKNASSKAIKYDDAELNENTKIKINLKKEIAQIKAALRDIAEQFGDIEAILSNPSRKKPNLALKKQVKGLIEEQQGILNAAMEKRLEDYTGKWGPDFEGFVFKFNDGTMVKITSAKFKAFKAAHDDTISMWLNQLEEE